jgi:hypothetical protein
LALQKLAHAEIDDKIVRYELKNGEVAPTGKPETIVSGIPITGDHPMRPFAIDAQRNLFVSMESVTNACEEQNRMPPRNPYPLLFQVLQHLLFFTLFIAEVAGWPGVRRSFHASLFRRKMSAFLSPRGKTVWKRGRAQLLS